MKTLQIALVLGAVFFECTAFSAEPVISGVTVRQRWPWSKLVDIDYVLTCDDAAQVVNIEIKGFDGDNELVLPRSSLSGGLESVGYGAHRIVWNPTATPYANAGMLDKFHVELTIKPVPLYMIVDLTKAADADGQIDYVYEADLRAGTWGSWGENPVTNRGEVIESVIWTGVTNDLIYATDKLVLRHVLPGSYTMGGDGEAAFPTTLTKGCYAGVFTVTEAQWAKIKGGGGSSVAKGMVSYNDIRGAITNEPAVNWPTTGSKVSPNSFLGQLRQKTGLDDFDLPTEAQWEYFCRAGTTTVFNDGNADAKYTGLETDNNGITNKYLNALGWYLNNSGDPTAVHPVGKKTANAWGLYDTHGNAIEWCLDFRSFPPIGGGTDPSGPLSGTGGQRLWRSGRHNYNADQCRSAFRHYATPETAYLNLGFRLVRTLK